MSRLHSQFDKSMRKMTLVTMKRTPPLTKTNQNHRTEVVQRHSHDTQGSQHHMPTSRAFIKCARDSQCCQQKPDQIAATVAHKDTRRRSVPNQESQQGTCQQQQRNRNRPCRCPDHHNQDGREDQRRNHTDARRKRIHIVQEVHRIREHQNPQDRRDKSKPGLTDEYGRPHARCDDADRHRQLQPEPKLPRQIPAIISQPGQE